MVSYLFHFNLSFKTLESFLSRDRLFHSNEAVAQLLDLLSDITTLILPILTDNNVRIASISVLFFDPFFNATWLLVGVDKILHWAARTVAQGMLQLVSHFYLLSLQAYLYAVPGHYGWFG